MIFFVNFIVFIFSKFKSSKKNLDGDENDQYLVLFELNISSIIACLKV